MFALTLHTSAHFRPLLATTGGFSRLILSREFGIPPMLWTSGKAAQSFDLDIRAALTGGAQGLQWAGNFLSSHPYCLFLL